MILSKLLIFLATMAILTNWLYGLPTLNKAYGEAGFSFLKLHLGPRTVALGGAGAAFGGGAFEGSDLNPAATLSDSSTLTPGYATGFRPQHIRMPSISWVIPYKSYRLLIHSRYLGLSEEIRGFNEIDEEKGTYGAHQFKVTAGLSGSFKTDFFWGININFAEHNIETYHYHSALVDIGARYRLFSFFWLGVAANNADFWTSDARTPDGAEPFPPFTVRAGISGIYSFKSLTANFSADARTRNDEKMHMPIGFELGWRQILFFRSGYAFLAPEQAVNYGVGLFWQNFKFDFVIKRHESLGSAYYFSLGIPFYLSN